MKNCKLLRLFVLCNCIAVSVQMFGMNQPDVFMDLTGCIFGPRTKIIANIDNYTKRNSLDNCNNEKTKKKKKAKPESSVEENTGAIGFWKPLATKVDYKRKTFYLSKLLSLGEFDNNNFNLKIIGSLKNPSFLNIKIENSKSSKEVYLTHNACDRKTAFQFKLIQHYLEIKKEKNTMTISIPGLFSENFQNLSQIMEIDNEKNKYDSIKSLSINLFIPAEYIKPAISLKSATMKGRLTNPGPNFVGESGAVYNMKGYSESGITEIKLSEESKVFGEKYCVVGGNVKVDVSGDSQLFLSGNPGAKRPTIFVGGKADKRRNVTLSGNLIDQIEYKEY